ncbi:hypothetical protein [Peredibacter starrii]|uniref:Uncharacterized protein n=1 Tax=Peredibacter starrii TaxID=28202 RepID=A0AAX4HKI6_9BACT|nr:hypothetical protein [Peredibacter starrii]WPU63534.1 hypothetical protein SOO65_12630 [Peredibacter starrii]
MGEIVGPLIFVLFAEFGVKRMIHAFDLTGPRTPAYAMLGYIILAAMFACLSFYLSSKLFIQSETFQLLNLIFTPLLLGVLMALKGKWLRRNEEEIIRLDTFWYGLVFGIVFVMIRYLALRSYEI